MCRCDPTIRAPFCGQGECISPLTEREADIASALNYEPGPVAPTGLRLVYSDTDVDALVRTLARTRGEIQTTTRARTAAQATVSQCEHAIAELRAKDQELTLRLNAHINRLSELESA
jgi:hypothetical protein